MLLAEASDTERYGRVEADAAGVVLTFVEKGGNPGPGLINAGMYLIDRRLLLTIPSNGLVSLEREVLPRWIGRGLYAYRSGGRFVDIGTPDAFAGAGQFFSRRTETGRSEE
jgi:NDP-sugar pyrophosphorylase family protein